MYFLFVTVYEWVTLCTLSSAIYFLNLFVLFGGGLCGTSRRSEDTLPCPASRSIRAATPMILRGRHHCSWLFSFRRLRRNHPVLGVQYGCVAALLHHVGLSQVSPPWLHANRGQPGRPAYENTTVSPPLSVTLTRRSTAGRGGCV